MASGQGFHKLSNGYTKKLWSSEERRGYFYVTTDRRVGELLDPEGFEVLFNGKSLGLKSLDSYGRIHVGRDFVNSARGRKLTVKASKGKLIINA